MMLKHERCIYQSTKSKLVLNKCLEIYRRATYLTSVGPTRGDEKAETASNAIAAVTMAVAETDSFIFGRVFF
jgi:hypothetical protein